MSKQCINYKEYISKYYCSNNNYPLLNSRAREENFYNKTHMKTKIVLRECWFY